MVGGKKFEDPGCILSVLRIEIPLTFTFTFTMSLSLEFVKITVKLLLY